MAPIFKQLAILGALFATLGSAVPFEHAARAENVAGSDAECKTSTGTTVKPIETLPPHRRAAVPQDFAKAFTARAYPARSENDDDLGPFRARSENDDDLGPFHSRSEDDDDLGPFHSRSENDDELGPFHSRSENGDDLGPFHSRSESGAAAAAAAQKCTKDKPCTGQGTLRAAGSAQAKFGACGIPNDGKKENVFGLSKDIFNMGLCGRNIAVTYQNKQIQGKVVDRCLNCTGGNFELSSNAYKQLSVPGTGRIFNVSWHLI